MNAALNTAEAITTAVAALGSGALTAEGIARHVAPLFSRVLERNARQIYLANHSLGRPLDATASDVAEAVMLWQTRLGGAWDAWAVEMAAYRSRLAHLIGAARSDCIVPKTSAGQGLRAILNSYDTVPHVVATRGEFDSVDVILREYARRGRITLQLLQARGEGMFVADELLSAVRAGADLVVLSQVLFNSGQVLPELPVLIASAHSSGAKVLLDVYHSLGALPVAISALDADFAIGGAYKYLRGGPGACFLYLHPRHLDGSLATLDVGWFAKKEPFTYERPEPPAWGAGGDAFLESTPPVLTWYQARAGQIFTLAIGVERLRMYTQSLQRRLVTLLAAEGIIAAGGGDNRGAFCTLSFEAQGQGTAQSCARTLVARGVAVDARGFWLRLCPDLLTTDDELARAAKIVAEVARQ
ncbi:MAG: aminotransferase class V-fold PLP-dependent enzyme [Casimicrobiaceae bacterium]